jgi:hypothetical protein
MSESNTDPKDGASPESVVTIGDNQYSLDDISSILNEHNELKTKFSEIDPDSLEVGNYVKEMLSKGPEGIKELQAAINQHLPQSEPEIDFDIDEENATPNEQKLMKALKYMTGLLKNTTNEIHMTKSEMKKLISEMTETAKLDNTASTAATRVEAELGIKVTAAEIKEAVKKTGLKDPVDAILVTRKNDVLKAKNPSKPKPNFVQETSSKRVNLDELAPMERIKVAFEHPELLDGWKPNQHKK